MAVLIILTVCIGGLALAANARGAGRALTLATALEREIGRLNKLIATLRARDVVEDRPVEPAPPAREQVWVEDPNAWMGSRFEEVPVEQPPAREPEPEPEPETELQPVEAWMAAAPTRERRESLRALDSALRKGWDQWIAANLLAVAGGIFVLLGASFFVAVAISHGWLTPPRQVAAALLGGLGLLVGGLRTWDGGEAPRARIILAQALAGAGAGVMLLGIVAGARIYDPPLYSDAVDLLGAGIVGALLVALSLRWNEQVTAGLGLATALGAPLLVGTSPTTISLAYIAVALTAAGCVIALRGWPWLLQLAIWIPAPQFLDWAIRGNAGTDHPAWLVLLTLVGWWLLVATPALLFEGGYRAGRIRVATASALFLLAMLASPCRRRRVRLVPRPALPASPCWGSWQRCTWRPAACCCGGRATRRAASWS